MSNSSGLGALITTWFLGALYLLCGLSGLIEISDSDIVFKYCLVAGLGLFIAFPALEWIFKNR